MSTSEGSIPEFPGIQVDYFYRNNTPTQPVAYFLSHIHTDHCKGLENYKAPAFIYCSSATRELLLRQEKYGNRKMFDDGILEARVHHYKHLSKVLRPLPLDMPTVIRLGKQREIRVTLLDANHCPGAVMFLIEDRAKAILYTGDIRAEDTWLQNLLKNPFVAPYALSLRVLKKIYLDTTFASLNPIHAEYPSKASGIQELLARVARFSPKTVFHINCWTVGYEDALSALAATFWSKIHADRYQLELCAGVSKCKAEEPRINFLNGFAVGNNHQAGVFTNDEKVRFHTCRPICATLKAREYVPILPVMSQGGNTLVLEVGAESKFNNRPKSGKSVDPIRYSFARHSSYSELCRLVEALRPRDVYPCVTPLVPLPSSTIQGLFGKFCSGDEFVYDIETAQRVIDLVDSDLDSQNTTQVLETSPRAPSSPEPPSSPPGDLLGCKLQRSSTTPTPETRSRKRTRDHPQSEIPTGTSPRVKRGRSRTLGGAVEKALPNEIEVDNPSPAEFLPARSESPSDFNNGVLDVVEEGPESQLTVSTRDLGSEASRDTDDTSLAQRYAARREAYKAIRDGNVAAWAGMTMISTSGQYEREVELG